MKTKILSGLICCLGIFSANAQTITAPTGQSLTITNPVNVTGGSVNIPVDSSFKISGTAVLSTKGNTNLFVGASAGMSNVGGFSNIFIGALAGKSSVSSFNNVFLGIRSGFTNTTGFENLFMGSYSGFSNTTGSYNYFGGANAGYSNTTGEYNLFLGNNSGYSTTSGSYNLTLGGFTGYSNTTGANNSFVGTNSGYSNTVGNQNTFFGNIAGYYNTTGSGNTCIGYNSQVGTTLTNATAIGFGASTSTSNTIVLGNAATTITGQGLAAGASGLKFANLNSSSATIASGGSNKVLSVDASGNVVLVALAGGATTTSVGGPVAESTWKNADGYLYNNSTNGVVINGAGLDGNALIVKGGVLSKEVNVKVEGAESWPDYVFKPSYKRMSLEEVEKFISINGHLPNVASATEMAATGNNLNKTDIKLLEKVEELTLYLLDMKKANDAQSAEIQSLKNQMNKLKKNRK